MVSSRVLKADATDRRLRGAEVGLSEQPRIGGMTTTPGYQLPADVADFANRYQEPLSRAIENHMRRLGVPLAMIGIDWRGIDPDPFVRYYPPQLGGNIRRGIHGSPGINLDPAVLDVNAPKMNALASWRSARLRDRIDAVIAHEYTEALAHQGIDFHVHALTAAENTPLLISDRARQILRDYRRAEGY